LGGRYRRHAGAGSGATRVRVCVSECVCACVLARHLMQTLCVQRAAGEQEQRLAAPTDRHTHTLPFLPPLPLRTPASSALNGSTS